MAGQGNLFPKDFSQWLSTFLIVTVLQGLHSTSIRADIPPVEKVKKENIDPVLEKKINDDPSQEHSLAETIQKNLTSLALTPTDSQKKTKENAHWYVRQRLDWRLRGTKDKVLKECTKDLSKRPFCVALRDLDRRERNNFRHRSIISYLQSIHSRYEINSWIKSGDVAQLSTATTSGIRQAFHKINSPNTLNKLLAHTLAAPTCKSSTLTQLLGTKLEEFLSDTENHPEYSIDYKKTVIQLYEKAASCPTNESVDRARYRLSLFYIWDNQCKSAMPHLDYLSGLSGSNDYAPRALFWKIQCTERLTEGLKEHLTEHLQTKTSESEVPSEAVYRQTQQTLMSKYPFSFHALLAQKNNAQKLPIALKADSSIQFRTTNNPILNEKIKAVEALLEIKESRLAQEILDNLGRELDSSDPEFRLYVGVLYHRLNFYLKNFQLLSKVFRDDSSLISKAAMELYYPKSPLQFYDLAKTELDEKLLFSLIRQESGFNTKAKSKVGARGLMQIMPGTAKRFERIRRYDKLFDPVFNLKIGSKYFVGLLEKYHGDAELALAAYNAGPKRVDQWLVTYPVKDRILFLDLIPFKETREYVASIARNYYWYAHLYPKMSAIAENTAFSEHALAKSPGQLFRFLVAPNPELPIANNGKVSTLVE